MKITTQIIAILAGIGATAAFEAWTTSDIGPRSKAHYAAVVSASKSPRDKAIAFGLKAFEDGQPAEAVKQHFAPDAIDHASKLTGRDAIAAQAASLDWLKPGAARKQLHVAGERDLAFVHYSTPAGERVEIYRIKSGLITEHWSVAAPTASQETAS